MPVNTLLKSHLTIWNTIARHTPYMSQIMWAKSIRISALCVVALVNKCRTRRCPWNLFKDTTFTDP
jgi:hypothetical protein